MMICKIQCFVFEIDKRNDGWWVAKASVPGVRPKVRKGYVSYPGGGIVKCAKRREMLEYLEYAYGKPLERL